MLDFVLLFNIRHVAYVADEPSSFKTLDTAHPEWRVSGGEKEALKCSIENFITSQLFTCLPLNERCKRHNLSFVATSIKNNFYYSDKSAFVFLFLKEEWRLRKQKLFEHQASVSKCKEKHDLKQISTSCIW